MRRQRLSQNAAAAKVVNTFSGAFDSGSPAGGSCQMAEKRCNDTGMQFTPIRDMKTR
jgi:hypothetical protein